MSGDESSSGLGVRMAFLRKFWEDRERGRERSLEEYQREFPGYESLIARLYQGVTGGSGAPEGATSSMADPSAVEELPRRRIGPYRLLRRLGGGGMGEVFLAEQLEPVQRQVAIKLTKPGMDSREVVARFNAERQALALMEHPNIASVFDAGESEDGRPYFVMEYVPGVPITEYCDGERLSISERIDLFLKVCDGVQHAHVKGIIHRDLKPRNVLVKVREDRAEPVIIDFGVAKATNRRLVEETLYTEFGQVIGTPAYMSPEQADPSSLDIDTRSDIYSLGVLLYELLVGVVPFAPTDLRRAAYEEIKRRVREEATPRPSVRLSRLGDDSTIVAERRRTDASGLRRQVRGDLDWIVLKALEKERRRRYQGIQELAADLRRHLRHEPVVAGPPGFGYRARKFVVRNRVGVALGAAFLLVAAASYVGSGIVVRKRFESEQTRKAESLFQRGQEAFENQRRATRRSISAKRIWNKAVRDLPQYLPVWERSSEFDAWDEYQGLRQFANTEFSEGTRDLTRALDLPYLEQEIRNDVRRKLVDVFRTVDLSSLDAASLTGAILPGSYGERLNASKRIELQTEPAGAEVYGFRYEERERRLVPLALRYGKPAGSEAATFSTGEPFLQLERVRDDLPLQPGDRWIEVDGEPTSTLTDLGRALRDVGRDQTVVIKVRRGEEELSARWVPYRADWFEAARSDIERTATPAPGDVWNTVDQFGIAFKAYPLAFLAENRLGATDPSGGLSIELPPGSYLLVFRKPDYADTRLPVAVPGPEVPRRVRLYRADAIPGGFVHVPAGEFFHGGAEDDVFQTLPAGETAVGDYLMSRREVTVAEYLEFLNDEETNSRMTRVRWKKGDKYSVDWTVEPSFEGADKIPEKAVIPRSVDGRPLIPVVPSFANKWVRRPDDERWDVEPLQDRPPLTNWPVMGISQYAAREFAAWKTRRHGQGRWRFRLPDDLQWEKAARGVDRRLHVWGSYLVWSFSLCAMGAYSRSTGLPWDTELVPFDESVYGVRDLMGSASEWTRSTAPERGGFVVWRGGNWRDRTSHYFRVENRNGRVPWTVSDVLGFRLVAEPIGNGG